LHAASPDYRIQLFIASPEHLSEVVRFELPRLGDIRGLRTVHPVLMALDEDCEDALLTAAITHDWNHGLGEIISALLRHGMRLTALIEHSSIPWDALPGQMSLGEDGEWRLNSQPERLPLSYTLQAGQISEHMRVLA